MSMTGTEMAEETTDQQRLEAKKAAAPVERRAAVNFFIMLGTPDEYANNETRDAWSKLMREAMGFMGIDNLEEFKAFLHWALEENALSAKYLRAARDPAVTLVKNLESLRKFYLAHLKGQEVLNKAKNKKKDSSLPAYREGSGNRTILKGDV
jgi:hypothetical protein